MAAQPTTPPSRPERPTCTCPRTRCGSSRASALFDGHDASINIMRRIMQSQGAEVVHLGHNRSVREVVDAAIEEDVQGVAVSSYQGGHVEYFEYLVQLLRESGAGHVKVVGGGGGVIVPSRDRPAARGRRHDLQPRGRPAARAARHGQRGHRAPATPTCGPSTRPPPRRCSRGSGRPSPGPSPPPRPGSCPTTCAPSSRRPPAAAAPPCSASPAPAARASRASPTSSCAGCGSTSRTSCASPASRSTRPAGAVAAPCSATASG